MRVNRFESAEDFYERVEGFLIEDEACHSLTLGIVGQLMKSPGLYREVPYLATIEQNGDVIAAAYMTPPHNPVLSLSFTPESILLLAEDLHELHPRLPGVFGPVEAARSFAETWQELTGQSHRKKKAQRIHRLEKVVPVEGVEGRLRWATEVDRELLTSWMAAFSKEASGQNIGIMEAERAVDAYLGTPGSGLHVWEDGDRPVSMAGFSRTTPNGVTVNYVYTPPEQRNRGYASACVATLSQLLLDEGYRYCFLFTDLANPTSNKIYQVIGYEPVCDMDEYEFGQVRGGSSPTTI